MADVIWPVTLPQAFLQNGLQITPVDNFIRSDMDSGIAKVRRRSTAVIENVSGQIKLDNGQDVILYEFFYTELQGGVLVFEWQHPRTDETKDFRFISTPTTKPLDGSQWLAQLELEILP